MTDRVFIDGKRLASPRVADIRRALAERRRVVMDDGAGIAIEITPKVLDFLEQEEARHPQP